MRHPNHGLTHLPPPPRRALLALGCLLSFGLAAGGCSKPKCGEGTVLQDGACVAENDGLPPGGNHPPTILNFSTNTTRITETDTLFFSAVVADQDGTADIVGGTLQSPEGAAYAAFQTDASEGTYSATVTWAALNTVLEIEFTGEATRSFIATFYDQAGATVSQTVDVTLFCDTGAACDGVCWDVTEDVMNCGACGNVCPKMEPEDGAAWDTRCTLGRCLVKTECFRSRNVSCDLACANEGYVCDEENGGYYGDVIGYFVNFDQAVCDYDDAEKIESCSERISEHEAASDFVSGYCFCWEQR